MVKENHGNVSCNGGGGALGHPKVYIAFKEGKAICPYCGKNFNENNTDKKDNQTTKLTKTVKK